MSHSHHWLFEGLGRATAPELSPQGNDVIATARQLDTLTELALLRASRSTSRAMPPYSARSKMRGPLMLVNNAGEIAVAPLDDPVR